VTFFRGGGDCGGKQRRADFRGVAETSSAPARLVMKARCAVKANRYRFAATTGGVAKPMPRMTDFDRTPSSEKSARGEVP
jgi:hypothetical protein